LSSCGNLQIIDPTKVQSNCAGLYLFVRLFMILILFRLFHIHISTCIYLIFNDFHDDIAESQKISDKEKWLHDNRMTAWNEMLNKADECYQKGKYQIHIVHVMYLSIYLYIYIYIYKYSYIHICIYVNMME